MVEEEVTSVLENAFSLLQGLKEIAFLNYNQGHIALSFGRQADMGLQQFELAALLRQVYPTLPATVHYPAISRGAASTVKAMPLLVYNAHAPLAGVTVPFGLVVPVCLAVASTVLGEFVCLPVWLLPKQRKV